MANLHHLRGKSSASAVSLDRPSSEEIRRHLDAVLADEEFCSSHRSSELLRHIVTRALAEDVESLKERLLGIEIFHRRSDYDTSTDAIVRVTVSDIRRRLANFYAENAAQAVRISLPLGSYVPDFITLETCKPSSRAAKIQPLVSGAGDKTDSLRIVDPPAIAPAKTKKPFVLGMKAAAALGLCAGMAVALPAGWWLRGVLRHNDLPESGGSYAFYNELLGPIGIKGKQETEIALTNPHVLFYLGLHSAGPPLGASPIDLPVPIEMEAVLNKTANDIQADFPFHHFVVDTTNYTGLGEATTAFGLARLLQATSRSARLINERFLNCEDASHEQLVILGAPHESAFVQSILSAANFTIGYDTIHNARPLPGEKENYSKTRHGDVLEDYGLIWMTKSPSGTRVLVLAGLSSAGTAGVGDFFSDPERMRPVYEQLRNDSKASSFPQAWQVLLRIEARQDVPVRVIPVAMRITEAN